MILRDQFVGDGLVLHALADLARDEIADRGIGLAIDQDVAEIALPDAEAALAVELFVKGLALRVGDLERAARVGRVDEAGKGLLAAREHLGIAGLDLLLRLGVDLAVVQRRAPVRRALEHGEMADLAGNGLDGLHAGGAGADHGDALAVKSTGSFGHRAVWKDVPLKASRPSMRGSVGVESGPIAVIRKRGREAAAVFQRDGPAPRLSS